MQLIKNTKASRNQRHLVLLIGDGFGVLKQIAFGLQRRGHSVIWAEEGQAGLRTAERESPNLVICETDLPDLIGLELCRTLKSSYRAGTPLVLIGTPGGAAADPKRALSAGADGYFADFPDSGYIIPKLEWLAGQFSDSKAKRSPVAASGSVVRNTAFVTSFE